MYKRIIIIALIFTSSLSSFSQEYHYISFPDSGVIWSEVYYCHDEDADEKTTYERFAVNGEDTVINSKIYTKLYIFYDTVFDKINAACIGGIREDSLKRVYYTGEQIHYLKPNAQIYANNDEIKLFDFGLKAGDTVSLFNSLHSDDKMIVSNIDTIFIGNSYRRRINFKGYESVDDTWSFNWIEGIGSTRGLLFITGSTPYYYNNHLICYKQNGNTLFLNGLYNECFPSTSSINETTSNIQIKVFPNPISGNEINFALNGLNIDYISIFNEYGCFISTYDVKGLNQANITIPSIMHGVYYYITYMGEREFVTGKFIVK